MISQENRFEKLSSFSKGLLILFTIIALLGLAELSIRLFYFISGRTLGDAARQHTRRMQTKMYYQYVPYVGFFYEPFKEVRQGLWSDRHGFIHHGDSQRDLFQKDDYEFRVMILGGSTVAGSFESSPQTSIDAQLEKALGTLFTEKNIKLKVNVINAGVGGYISTQEFALLRWCLLGLKPDYVIFLDGSNDFVYWVNGEGNFFELIEHDINPYHWNIFASYNRMFTLPGVIVQAFDIMSDYSAIIDFNYKLMTMRYRLKGDNKKKLHNDEKYLNDQIALILKRYQTNIQSSVALCKEFNIGIAYFLQPTLLRNSPNLTPEEQGYIRESDDTERGRWEGKNYLDYKGIFYQKAATLMHQLQKQNKNHDVIIDNFADIFKNKSKLISFYGDNVHYTDAGREIIIKNIVDKIGPSIINKALNTIQPN
jgi:hypothetical protein